MAKQETHKWHYLKPMPDMTPQEALQLAIAYVTAAMNPPSKIEDYGLAETPAICEEAVEQLPGPLQRHFEYAGEYEDGDFPSDPET